MRYDERYKNDLDEIEECFNQIKMKPRKSEKQLFQINKILVRMFGDQFKCVMVDNSTHKFFGMTVFPSMNTCESIITNIIEGKSKSSNVLDIWKGNKDWVIEIDSLLFDDLNLNVNPKELTAILMHEIGHTVYSNSIPQRLFKVMRYQMTTVKLSVRNMMSNVKMKALITPVVIEACSTKILKYVSEKDENEADKFVVNIGLGDALNSFINKLLVAYGNSMLNKRERDAEMDIESVFEWSITNIEELRSRKTKLKKELTIQMISTPSIFIKKAFNDIKGLFFGGDSLVKFDQLVTEQTMLESYDTLVKNTEYEIMTEMFHNNKIKKIDRSEVDYIRIQTENISSSDDKIYLLDLIYYQTEVIKNGLKLIAEGKQNKVRETKSELDDMMKELQELRQVVLRFKIPEKSFSVFVKYPKGYEG